MNDRAALEQLNDTVEGPGKLRAVPLDHGALPALRFALQVPLASPLPSTLSASVSGELFESLAGTTGL